MSETMKAIISIDNQITHHLDHEKKELSWGKWEDRPTSAPAGATTRVFIAEGKSMSMSGCTGWVDYEVDGDESAWFRIKFDCPYNGKNYCKVTNESKEFTDKYTAKVTKKTPPDGDCVATITVAEN